ncbi:MAG: alpha/beta hydrolase [Deinococcales bacterium]
MESYQESFSQAADGLKLFACGYQPSGPVKAVVVISHGYAEHVGRYKHVAEALRLGGYRVELLDHRGHGKSEGARANIQHFSQYRKDLAAFIDKLPSDLAIFLLGHSMGGAVALDYALEHQARLKGLILSAPFLANATPVSPVLKSIAQLVGQVVPDLALQPLDARAISRIEAVVKAYQQDPLVYNGKVKARIGAEMIRIGPELLKAARNLALPLLIIHGDDDKIAALSGSQQLFKEAGSSDKQLKIYPKSYHEVFNDLDAEQPLRMC